MPKSSPSQKEEQKKAPEVSKHERTKLVILFWSYSPGMEKILAGAMGRRPPEAESSVIYETRVESPNNRVVVLHVPPFENSTISDTDLVCNIALELQDYLMKRVKNKSHNSISALYLHLGQNKGPTLAAQRNFRALWHIKELLKLTSLSACVVLPPDPKEPPQNIPQNPLFQNMIDFKVWVGHLAYPRPKAIDQFMSWVLGSPHRNPYVPPAEPLTSDALIRTFCEAERRFFEDLERQRVQTLEDVLRLQSEQQSANKEAQVAREDLEALTIQHNSLLKQLNLRDNTELNDIVQQFRGLNDDIDEFSLNFSQALGDDIYKQYPDCDKCNDPMGLRGYFHHWGDSLLLLKSTKGTVADTRQFLEFFCGSVVCHYLHNNVFRPFHPMRPGDVEAQAQNKAFSLVYRELRLRDPQMLSSKWRVDTYSTTRTLSNSNRQELTNDLASYISQKIVAVCGFLFGDRAKPATDASRLIQLIERALKLNDRIKEEVVHAGDIHTEYFHYNTPYEDLKMKVLDAEPGDPLPTHIVSTCGLGVWFTKAVGGGKEPESKILLKATVASDQMYE
ncbi:hypothetical protein RhiJN_08600 [Ceratobasidium sp. AG-Ba]|nr:hypothetical protein RhiJN_08600 [Ceratobasidium sp. AG-Ba]QRW09386.1 hypothetical protein RhiLY_08385 [Ceratobasidium sp. AG-Ba]